MPCSVFWSFFLLKFWDRGRCGGSIMASMTSVLRQLHPLVGRRMIACSTWRLDRTIPNSAADYLYRESLWLQRVWGVTWCTYVLKSIPIAICPHHKNESDSKTIFSQVRSRYTCSYIKCQVRMGWIQGVKYVKTQNIISSYFFHPRPIFIPASTRRASLGRRDDGNRLRSTNLPKIEMTEEQRDLFQTAKAKFPSQKSRKLPLSKFEISGTWFDKYVS